MRIAFALVFLLATASPLLAGRARTALTRPAEAIVTGARGRVEVLSKSRREQLTIRAERLSPRLPVQFFLADAQGVLRLVGSTTASARGQARIQWHTRKTALPLGAASLADLAGHAVEIRDGGGSVLLAGAVPGFTGGPASDRRLKGRTELENIDRSFAPEGKARVSLDELASRGRSKLGFEVEGVPPRSRLEIFVQNPATGGLEKVAEVDVAPSGEAEVEFETQDGDSLPFGVPQIGDLFGKSVEIRSGDGSVRFQGSIPTP